MVAPIPPKPRGRTVGGNKQRAMPKTEPYSTAPKGKPRFAWRALVSLLFVAVAIGSWGTVYLCRTFSEERCRKHLWYLCRALMISRKAAEGHFPPAYFMDSSGRRVCSWRACVAPYLDWDYGASGRMYKFAEPWDGPANTLFRSWYDEYYSCPLSAAESGNANYLCVVGGALWPLPRIRDESWTHPSPRSRLEGGMLPSRGKAILLVEVVQSDIPWTKPEDISLAEITALLREDPSGERFRRSIRYVVAVDANEALEILAPARDIEEIRALVASEGER